MHLLNLGQGFDAHAKTEFSVARDVDIEIFNKSVCKNIILICLETQYVGMNINKNFLM